jgi:hypothetical protein
MNGKGDAPRNCFSKQFKDNYETINWSKKNPLKTSEQKAGKGEQALQQATEGIPSRLSDVQRVR